MSDSLWWFGYAACNGIDRGNFLSPANGFVAKRCRDVCNGCPVEEVCLWYGMQFESPGLRFGVFGGMLPAQRQALGVCAETAEVYYRAEREHVRRELVAGA